MEDDPLAAAHRPRPLGDDELADEIELYGAVVVAASAAPGDMSTAAIDEALGVPAPAPEPAATPAADGDRAAGSAPGTTPGPARVP